MVRISLRSRQRSWRRDRECQGKEKELAGEINIWITPRSGELNNGIQYPMFNT